MADRSVPYGAFNFRVSVINFEKDFAGFSDVSGLTTDVTIAEYRNGNDGINHVRKIPGIYKVGDVTLKRGVINSDKLWEWINLTRTSGIGGRRDVAIELFDETGKATDPPQVWTLRNCVPMKYTGPTLAAKGGGDVAIEELVLSVEQLEFGS